MNFSISVCGFPVFTLLADEIIVLIRTSAVFEIAEAEFA